MPSSAEGGPSLMGRFRGVEFRIYRNEHGPPHFQARTQEGNFNYHIEKLECLSKRRPSAGVERAIRRWGLDNQEFLRRKWNENAGSPPHQKAD